MRIIYLFGLVFFAFLFTFTPSTYALTIDEFDGLHGAQAHPGEAKSSTSPSANAVGGFRTLTVLGDLGINGLFIRSTVEGGVVTHSQDATVTGSSAIKWDGNADDGIDFTGLAGLDLTQDGGTALRLEVLSFDFSFNNPISISVTLYDASDEAGNKSSTAFMTLTQQIASLTVIDVQFSEFIASGSLGGADLTNIGAIILSVNGILSPAIDLTFDWAGTNGECRRVPDANGRVLDVCGVCGGDGQSCLDCAGTPFGKAKVDQCGVCNGDGTSCLDCAGNVFGTAELDRCGVCQGDGTSCLACESFDITKLQTILDGGAKKQEAVIKRIALQLSRVAPDSETQSYVATTKALAHQLQLRNWILSWTLPSISTVCQNVTFCVASSNDPVVEEYRTHSEELLQIGLDLLVRYQNASGNFKFTKRFTRKAQKLHQRNMRLADQVPKDQYYCS